MKYFIIKIIKFLAKRILSKYKPEIVGITGSVGKMSVKEITVGVLARNFRVRGNIFSYNNELGLPLTIIGKQSPGRSVIRWCGVLLKGVGLIFKRDANYPEILVLEMAANHPGDIESLINIAPCHVGVVAAVSQSHLKFFKTVKKVAQEKRLIVSHLKKTGYAILNRDDAEVFGMRKKTDADVITFGFHPEADVRTSDMSVKLSDDERHWPEGMFFKVIYNGSVVPMYLSGIVGEHSIYRASAAIAIALVFGMNLVEISTILKDIKMPPIVKEVMAEPERASELLVY